MKIEVLYVPNCPNHAVAMDRLRAVLSPDVFKADVREILVKDLGTAQFLRFPGSPTIRVNGDDVEPQSIEGFGLMCRLYSDGTGAPSPEQIRALIEKAAFQD